ncbi:MAG: DMT family transporter [Actinomycetota bacterium]|nr:DMT family transporter [Actinomycetota bacterium]
MSDLTYRLMAVAGVTCISFAPILVRVADDAGDLTIAFFRSLYALPFLAVLYLGTRQRDHRPRKNRLIAVAAGVFLALDLTFWHASIREIGAGLATVVVNMQVVIVALLAWVLFQEKPGRRAVALLPVIILGVVLISGVGSADAYGDNPGLGTAQSLLSAVFYAFFVLLLRESGRGHSSPSTGPVFDSTIGTTIATLFIGLTFAPDFDLTISWPLHGWLLLLAIVSQVAGWLLIARALPQLPALDTSVLLLGQPMLAILWARLIFDEALGVGQWLGVALMLTGLVAFSLRKAVADSGEARQESGEPIDKSV